MSTHVAPIGFVEIGTAYADVFVLQKKGDDLVTASFVPLELFEVVKHFKIGTRGILAVNVAVVCYLANALAIKRREEIRRRAKVSTA